MHNGLSRKILAISSFLILTVSAFAGTAITPTTTLATETGNNTSTANTFVTASNGNIGATNISKVDVHSLVYPGANFKVYAHFMGWFGGTNHMNVGYRSDDPVQVKKQVTDMMSRGIDGAIIDWYGPNSARANSTTQYLMKEAETRGGKFEFAVMEDVGALKTCAATTGCDITQTLIDDLNYAYNNYELSTTYMRSNGQPVVFFFGVEAYTIDWTRVRANVLGNPLFVQRNSGAFSKSQWNGAFAWNEPKMVTTTDPMAMTYLDDFYATGNNYPVKLAYGSGYKGFDGSLSSWSQGKYIGQNCGQTWLKTMAEAGRYYSATKQLNGFQLVTWNDYEEGTSLETGIENCVTVSAAMSGTTLTWNITGDPSTLDHYTLYISADGVNLMTLGKVPVAQNSLDLAPFGFAPGAYTVYVKAVGKSMIANKMSSAVAFSMAQPVNLAPTVTLAVSPNSGVGSVNATATMTASDSDGTIASSRIDFGDGTSTTAMSATHLYSTPGTFTVTATATDNLGASNSQTQTVTVAANQPPQAVLSLSPATAVVPFTMSASTSASTDADGSIASSKIDFGDGTVLSGTSLSHTYSVAGTYTVTATVTDNLGASSTASATVTATAPAPKVTISTPATGSTVTSPAHILATGWSSLTVTTMKIYVDNVQAFQVSGPNVDASLSMLAGAHYVVVQGWDTSGAVFKTGININVLANVSPVAQLTVTPTSGTGPLTVQASAAASYDSDGSISNTTLDFGDGTVLTATSASHIYNTAGTYAVTATVWDNAGASSSTSSVVTVASPAVVPSSITVTSPTNNGKSKNPVHVVASGFSAATITTMQVYVDGKLAYQVSGSKVDTNLAISPGGHNVVVQGWDSAGAVVKSGVIKINVSGGGTNMLLTP